eukprot:TRINITY_DN730_c0_g1_i2.p1 TRINITY_DN730_c0_g1~~TRINITY_DN730_c0_g1_i2.p1  ORF type:complete len:227 (-),score=50.97 TRINITY_DN730_c0_g1_i2:48-728(-)
MDDTKNNGNNSNNNNSTFPVPTEGYYAESSTTTSITSFLLSDETTFVYNPESSLPDHNQNNQPNQTNEPSTEQYGPQSSTSAAGSITASTFTLPRFALPNNYPQFLSDKEYEKLLLDFKEQYTQNLDPSIPDLSEVEENLPPIGTGYIYFSQPPLEKEKKRLKTLWENSGRLKEGSGEIIRKKYRILKKDKRLKKRILSLLKPPEELKELEGIYLIHIAWSVKKTT